MNKEVKKTATNNIIFDDKELEVQIRNLIKKANQKGFYLSHLTQAITTIWRDEFPIEKTQNRLSQKEKIFSKKVQNFLSYYENDLSAFYYEHFKSTLFNETDWNSNISENYYKILCSMYGVLERENKITKRLIIEFARKHFAFKSTNISDEIDFLYNFVYFHLYFNNPKTPEYSKDLISVEFSIQYQKKFSNLKFQYGFSRIRAIDTSLALIYIIKEYF